MTLKELGEQYWQTAEDLDQRAEELKKRPDAKEPPITARIAYLIAQATACRGIANKLIHYRDKEG